jgi:hypothetical protein
MDNIGSVQSRLRPGGRTIINETGYASEKSTPSQNHPPQQLVLMQASRLPNYITHFREIKLFLRR